MQFAHQTNRATSDQNARAAAGVHGWMVAGFERCAQRSQQGFHVALHIEEIDGLLLTPPLQHVVRTIGQTGHTHGLVKTFHRGVGIAHAAVPQEHTAQLEDTYPLGLAVEVELQNL